MNRATREIRKAAFVPSHDLVLLAAEVLGRKSGRKLSHREAREALVALGEFFGALREGPRREPGAASTNDPSN